MSVGSGKLQAAHRGLIGVLHFGHDRREAAVAQAILGERERHHLVAAFAIEQLARRQPGLLEPGRVEIEPGQRPGDARIGVDRKTGRRAGDEERRGGIVAERRGSRRDFVQAAAIKTAAAKPGVDRRNPERQTRRIARHRHGDARLELGEQACPIGLGKGGNGLHKKVTTRMFPVCSDRVRQFVKLIEHSGHAVAARQHRRSVIFHEIGDLRTWPSARGPAKGNAALSDRLRAHPTIAAIGVNCCKHGRETRG